MAIIHLKQHTKEAPLIIRAVVHGDKIVSSSPKEPEIYQPGSDAPKSGIYRCIGCGFESVASEGEPLAPQHIDPGHEITWQLVVEAEHKPG